MKKRKININRASARALEELPLIGPKRAARIVEFRKEHGPFRSIHDLDLVPGIGSGIVRRLAPFITI